MLAGFKTPLVSELISEVVSDYRGQWILKAPLVYHSLVANREIIVPAGFVTDFESCPRVPVIFYLFGEICHAAAVIHDYLYSHPVSMSRQAADAVLREACIISGVPRWRAWGVWAGVRIGGASRFGGPGK